MPQSREPSNENLPELYPTPKTWIDNSFVTGTIIGISGGVGMALIISLNLFLGLSQSNIGGWIVLLATIGTAILLSRLTNNFLINRGYEGYGKKNRFVAFLGLLIGVLIGFFLISFFLSGILGQS